MAPLGRTLIAIEVLLVVAGGLVLLLGRLGLPLGRLPGDSALRGKPFAVFASIATCLLLSLLMSLAIWLVNYFRR